MKNFLSEGVVIDVTAPAGGATSGAFYMIGKLFGFFVTTAAEGARVGLRTEGKFQVAKLTAAAWAEGDAIYWKTDTGEFTKTATANTKVAVSVSASAADADGIIKLLPSTT